MNNQSLYEILQVRLDASPEVIKAAYKTLTAKYHPDRDSSKEAARAFAEIQRAYEVLSDPVRRRQYDMNPSANRTAAPEPVAVLRTDGSSTFLTLAEHQRRGWQEAAGCDLSSRDFSGVSFQNAKLVGARLDGSRFIGCDFRGADLTNCSAKRCQFDKVDFARAKLVNSDLSNCSIREAKFFGIGKRWESVNVDPRERFTESDYLK
ncbi:MAG: DnaJ domain-containing protein [Planctomycetaceae bacterium]